MEDLVARSLEELSLFSHYSGVVSGFHKSKWRPVMARRGFPASRLPIPCLEIFVFGPIVIVLKAVACNTRAPFRWHSVFLCITMSTQWVTVQFGWIMVTERLVSTALDRHLRCFTCSSKKRATEFLLRAFLHLEVTQFHCAHITYRGLLFFIPISCARLAFLALPQFSEDPFDDE